MGMTPHINEITEMLEFIDGNNLNYHQIVRVAAFDEHFGDKSADLFEILDAAGLINIVPGSIFMKNDEWGMQLNQKGVAFLEEARNRRASA